MLLKSGLRRLWRTPGFASTVVALSLAVVAVNATVFAAIWGLHGKALPYRDGDALVRLEARMVRFDVASGLNQSLADQLAQDRSVFAGVVGHRRVAPGDAREGGDRYWRIDEVTGDFAEVLGVAPVLGRSFLAGSGGPEAGVLLTDRHWRERFDADPDVLGRIVHLGDAAVPVIGVMPPGFSFPAGDVQAFMAIAPTAADAEPESGVGSLNVIGRLADGVSVEAARARLDALLSHEAALALMRENYGLQAKVTPLRAEIAGGFTRSLQLLALAGVLLLLVVAANLTGLIQDRLLARQREFAICRAVGARRIDLSRSALFDLLVPVFVGGSLGMACVPMGLRFLQQRQLLPADSVVSFGVDASGFLAALACVVILVLSVLVVLTMARGVDRDPGALNERSAVSGLGRLRPLLLVAQVALTTALVGSAGLLLNSAWRLSLEERGFDAGPVVLTGVDLMAGRGPAHRSTLTEDELGALQVRVDTVRQAIAAHPGVERVALASMPPFSGWRYMVPMASPDDPEQRIQVHSNQVSTGYFETMGIPVQVGRGFSDADFGESRAVIVDALYRQRHLGDRDPLLEHLPATSGEGAPGAAIIGVVGSVRHSRVDEPSDVPMIYAPLRVNQSSVFFVTRSGLAPARMAEEVRALVVHGLPEAHVFVSEPLTASINRTLVAQHALLEVIGLFGALTLALAVLGLYTVISVMVRRRTRELGLRMALGADATRIERLVVGRGGALVVLGVALGLPAGLALSRLMVDHLHQIAAHDPATWLLVLLAVLVAGLIACWLPARRAAGMSPVAALQTLD